MMQDHFERMSLYLKHAVALHALYKRIDKVSQSTRIQYTHNEREISWLTIIGVIAADQRGSTVM